MDDVRRLPGRVSGRALLAFLAAVAAVPWLLPNQYLVHVGVLAGLHVILAVGLNLVMGYAGQVSLGHAGFYGLGAYVSAVLSVRYGLSPWLGAPVAGLHVPSEGRVTVDGRDVTGRPPEVMLRAGVALVPERRRIFGDLTVLDNLELGGYALPRGADFSPRLAEGVEAAYALFPVLRQRSGQLAGTLSGGEQQMLAIGRALMTRPRLLLCDEPSLGLAPLVVGEIMRLLARLREGGTTILLVEQNARLALRFADRAYVLEVGRVALSGASANLLADDQLKAAYLGA